MYCPPPDLPADDVPRRGGAHARAHDAGNGVCYGVRQTTRRCRATVHEGRPAMPDDFKPKIYDGDGDVLMSREQPGVGPAIALIPDALPSKAPDRSRRMRIMWGQHLLEDVLAGRYRSLVCAVNADDN